MVQTLDPANQQRRLLPLIKEVCELPPRLNMLTPVNFADPDSAPYVWRQLLTALGVQPEPEEVAQPTAADWHLAHPYPMQPNFTGRKGERATLTTWLNAGKEPLLVLRALGGFGKSALSWYWLTHDLDPHIWPRVVFWSFCEGDASFDRFLSETLAYLSGGQPSNAPQGRPAVDALLRHLQQPGTLLILDGFERPAAPSNWPMRRLAQYFLVNATSSAPTGCWARPTASTKTSLPPTATSPRR